ncbi:hypothetical protein BC828DRAFT_86352 [Blastocladiella britannica]|nr:hypothetical protein BC828DRAFT_86352 [Blastocladiella britannica]
MWTGRSAATRSPPWGFPLNPHCRDAVAPDMSGSWEVSKAAYSLTLLAAQYEAPTDYFGDGRAAKLYELVNTLKTELGDQDYTLTYSNLMDFDVIKKVFGRMNPACPLVFTIGKSSAEREAIRTAFGLNQAIELCEFHVFQALRRWLDGRVGRDTAKIIICDFRQVFNVRTLEEFKEARSSFVTMVTDLLRPGLLCFEVLRDFQRNRFSPVWLPYFLDAGMPSSLVCGELYTNNILETLFRAFDTMIRVQSFGSRRTTRMVLGIGHYTCTFRCAVDESVVTDACSDGFS